MTRVEADPRAVLGLAGGLTASRARVLRGEIVDVWESAIGPLRELEEDLEALRRLFYNPVATGRTIRSALAAVRPPRTQPIVARELLVEAGPGTFLPTPEARLVLELLDSADRNDGPLDIPAAAIHEAVAFLALLYRGWSRHRLDETLALVNGRGRPLQLMPIGGVLTLLVNRADDPSRAIGRFPKGSPRAERLDKAFFAPAASFADAIKPRKPGTAPERLISGWTLSEVSVRVPGAIHISDTTGVFVDPDHRSEVLELIRRELFGRGLSAETIGAAFDSLVATLGEQAPVLAGFGLLFERPAATLRLRSALLEG